MTDNRTELRKLLDERGIEYAESQDRFRTRFRFNYCEACSDYLNEIEIMGACITALKSYLTPEQAIAATLGTEYHGYEQAAIEAWKSIKTWNTRATYGTLTAEQVEKAIRDNSSYASYDGLKYYASGINLQAIADELYATVGNVTCELEQLSALGVTLNMLNETSWGVCSECGTASPMDSTFCRECGRRVD